MAETIRYRFDAQQTRVQVLQPLPGDSLVAAVALIPRLSGTFSYDTTATVTHRAGIPGRVAFAAYATGTITIDALEPGGWSETSVTVTDGLPRTDDPARTMPDAVTLGARTATTDGATGNLDVTLRYLDADRLDGVGLPAMLDLAALGQMTLVFSSGTATPGTATPGTATPGDRTTGAPARSGLLGLAIFDISRIERLD